MKSISLSQAASYRTLFTSLAHVSPEDLANLKSMVAAGYYFVHNVEDDFTGVICRFGAVTPDSDVGDVMVGDYGFSSDFGEMIAQFKDGGFDAVHFDVDGDLVEGVTWYTEEGSKVIPLAYGVEIKSYDSLSDSEREKVDADLDPEYSQDDNFIFFGETYIAMSAVMRLSLDGSSEMRDDYGFTGSYGESNVSALFIKVSDDGDTADIVRVM